MFKQLAFASAILVAATGVAMANPAPYVGASLGVNINTPTDSSSIGGFRGAPVSLLAGYGGTMNDCFYLAGELNAVLLTSTMSGGGLLKSTYGYGISILPGYMLSDHTVAFARVGMVRTKFSTIDKYSNGGQVGLGVQTSVTQNLDVRGEYDFTAYSAMSTYAGSIAPRSDATTLSLIYKFD